MAEKFDLMTHRRDKNGRLVSENHYVLHVRNGQRIFERPPKSGICYYEDGRPVAEPAAEVIAAKVEGKKSVEEIVAASKLKSVSEPVAIPNGKAVSGNFGTLEK